MLVVILSTKRILLVWLRWGWGVGGQVSACFPVWGVVGIGGSVRYYVYGCCQNECGADCGRLIRVCLGLCTTNLISGIPRPPGIGPLQPAGVVAMGTCKKASPIKICAACSIMLFSCRFCVSIPDFIPAFGCARIWPFTGIGCRLEGRYYFRF